MYKKDTQKALYELSKAYLDEQSEQKKLNEDQQLSDLRELIVYHEWRYYILNDPVISDFEYDSLFKQLEAIEAAHPDWITPDSPTQRVSADLSSDFESVPHLTPMLSLGNSYNAEDLRDFDQQIKRLLNMPEDQDIEYAVEPKFDGGSIALVYENDMLVRAATRGNGTMGDDITNNGKAIYSIPLKAAFSKEGINKVEVRGEVLIRKDRFDAMNAERSKANQMVFANARNAATGGLRMKDPREVAKRNLEAFIYTLGYAVDDKGEDGLEHFSTHDDSLEFLSSIGFKVPVQERAVCKNIEEAINFCLEWQEKREGYEYEIDGMVVKVNSRELQERAGHTSHHPRWAIAFKFQAKQATTKLESVEYQVGKIGSITPVAKVAPVQLAGVTISSISLHNADFIEEKDLHIDDTVLIERAGDVIPYIVKALDELRDGSEQKIEFPKVCPVNSTDTPVELVRTEGEAAWRCPDCVCGSQDLQRIIFHVSKPAMNIDGMGKSIVERFYEMGWIRTIADVYQLDYEKIGQLEGFGTKSAANLKSAIDKAKHSPISRLLHSLAIHHLGKKVSKLLAQEINHVLDLQNWEEEDYTNIKDVGPKVAENVRMFFANERNIALLKQMESLGVNLTQTEADKPRVVSEDAPLAGKTILFTGKLEKMSRKEAQMKAEAAGARNISAVSSKLSILVAGEKAGSKLKKAQALETVQILTEDEFLALVD